MDIDRLFSICCGYSDDGNELRLFLEGPNPAPSFDRNRPRKTNIFYLFVDNEADAIRAWLSTRKAWSVLKVPPPYSKDRGIAALRIARSWSGGPDSPFFLLASTRRIDGEGHRDRLRVEVNALVGAVIENPTNPQEYLDLVLLREVIESAPVNVELATFREVWSRQDRTTTAFADHEPAQQADQEEPTP